jgi:hypothetical protein
VVALAALGAMDKGRRHMWQRSLDGVPGGPELSQRAARRAVIHFQEQLHDFASLGRLPKGGNREQLHDHPFLCLATAGATRMRVCCCL